VGTAVVGLAVGLWAYGVSLRRVNSGPAVLASLFLALLVVAPYPLGERPIDTGIAAIYNRYGAGILGIVLIETYRPSTRSRRALRRRVCQWLAALSQSQLLRRRRSACGTGPFYGRLDRRCYFAGLSAGFVLVALPMLWYLHFDWVAMVKSIKSPTTETVRA
jgi:hypothetical protein